MALVIDRSRQLGREINVNEVKWQEVEPAVDCEMPLDELTRHETNEELTTALDQLTPAQKRVLLLRYFGDLSYEEIGHALHLNEKTVSSRLSKCLDRLEMVARPLFQPGKLRRWEKAAPSSV